MRIKYIFKNSFSSLGRNKGRSALTILGIVIGIASVIIIVSVGEGAQGLILNQLGAMGAETIVIRPGREPKGPSDIGRTMFSDSLKDRDVEALRRKSNVPYLKDVTPGVMVAGSVSYGRETFTPTIFGWSAEVMSEMLDMYPEEGRNFTEDEIRQMKKLAVIGSKVKEELFGEEDPLGKYIKIRNKKFKVVGVYPSRGQTSFFNINEVVIIPYTTAQKYLLGINYYHEIVARVVSAEYVERTAEDIKATLRQMHKITDPDKDDFFLITQEGIVKQIKTITDALTAFLAAVVAVSLLVGGVGVMNIMLVSVVERTKEIGLRKAVGATERDILWQFLLEAAILTSAGGLVGIILGSFCSFLLSITLSYYTGVNWPFTFPLYAVILSLSVSFLVGLVFGIYPARQASKKSPIEALRYE